MEPDTRLRILTVFLLAAALCAPLPVQAEEEGTAVRLDLRDPGWELAGEDAVVEEFDGEFALRLKSGSATWRGIELRDGTIEFDLQVTKHRSFSYLYFRMESDEEHEEVYFRSHKSLLPDAVQYTPVYKGSSQWQLYHDDRSTAAAPFPPGEWIPIKVVVQGRQAAIFVGDAEKPRLVVPRLAREPKAGFLALRSFMTFGTPADTYVSNFANVVVRPGVVDYEFPPLEPQPTAPPGRIVNWEISPAFVPAEDLLTTLPSHLLAGEEWQKVSPNVDGLVELERWVSRPEGARRAGVLARFHADVPRATIGRLDLGFSDEVGVFLNGRLLVADDESYSFNLPRRQGLLSDSQLSVFLPLEAGANEVVLAVVDRFGGWGVSATLTVSDGPKAPDAAESGSAGQGVERLAWLAGCWQGEAGEECWLAPRDGSMLAMNRGPARADKAPAFELLRVVEADEGLVLLAQPGGRSPATPFGATEVGDSQVIFANPAHDFPQRITYRRDGATLRARVEAQQDGEWRGFEQVWHRANWPGD
jgi:hypothetical protein